ncbi:hypothetical protein CLV49_1507 [Labedella gwakjiensis]|uniref:Uncharacterized protein n=1 Tax=Labedella gwakjiensis TaxID=390269 RepID=A0A2P8GVB5_9MICO|nr:hypothetical protein [Labedella gwakjiensis]PSL37899.1 hypothetical protein CLV49_1507 [Labedella gwakjiensis]RUQ87532.1 hypothetical protein ELQ93_11660 [Labedella gwakjiensis]
MTHHRWTSVGIGAAALACAIVVSTTGGASAAPTGEITTYTGTVTSASCLEQVRKVAAQTGSDRAEGESLCSGTVRVTETTAQKVTASEVASIGKEQRLTVAETDVLRRTAANGGIYYRDWTHSYWVGGLTEKHTGRTYWDGHHAWNASYRGFKGSHTCHSEGGLAIGWSVEPISCPKPGPRTSADAYYRFDASAVFKGSPVTLNIGLHNKTSATGKVTLWQVGG